LQDVAVRAVEFWTAIAEEEVDYVDTSDPADQHFVTRHLAGLVQMTTQLMSRIDEFNDDENYGVAQAAAVCLTSCTAVARDEIVPFVMKFIRDNLVSSDWRVQDACTMAFGCILDGPSDEVLTDHINSALPFMISKIHGDSRDLNVVLRESAAWTIGAYTYGCTMRITARLQRQRDCSSNARK
jgi:importin subunit beta-1